jgi:hypothetical protein
MDSDFPRNWMWSEACAMLARADGLHRELFRPTGPSAGTRVLPMELRTAIIHRLELPQGRFERRVRLPAGRYSAVRRSAVDGCLLITLQKLGAFRG